MDNDESVRVMLEFIFHHPITIPPTKIPNPNFTVVLPLKAFEWFKIDEGVLECKITDDRIVPYYKETFLRLIGVSSNPKSFKVVKFTSKELQYFLAQIDYKGEFKDKEVDFSWHLDDIDALDLRGLSGKHGDTDMSKDWLYVVYSIFTYRSNVLDLPEVLW